MDIRIEAKNFMRLKNIDVEFPDNITIVAGINEAGKSSLAEAIRFAILGDTPRVKLKRDYKYLIHDGSRSGKVTLTLGDKVMIRNVRDGKPANDCIKYGGMDEDILNFTLGSMSFARATDAKRREIITRYTGADENKEEVFKQLEDAKVDQKKIDEVAPLLKHSFDSAHKRADENYAKLRGAWESITEERFGSRKGDWSPEIPETHEDVINALQDDVSAIFEIRNDKLAEVNAEEKKAIADKFDADEQKLSDLRDQVVKAKTDLKVAESLLSCPECGSMLEIESGKDGYALTSHKTDGADFEKIQETIDSLTEEGKTLSESIKSKKETLMQVFQDKRNAIIKEMDEQHETARNQLNSYITDRDTAKRLNNAVSRAADTHKLAMEWLELRELLSEKGDSLRSAVAASGTEVINQALQDLGHLLGMRPVAIEADMSIRRTDGRPYDLLSESARWRVSAMLSLALAKITGTPLVILDRMDVINVRDRVQFLQGLSAWAEDYNGKVIVLATLKEKPTASPVEGIGLQWLENGAIR